MVAPELRSPELARETLRTLVARRLPPTPENYTAIFNELSGAPVVRDRSYRALAAALGAATWIDPEQSANWLRMARTGDWEPALGCVVAASRPAPDLTRAQLIEQLARTIEYLQPALGDDDPRVQQDAQLLIEQCRAVGSGDSLAAVTVRLQEFNRRLAFVSGEQAELRVALIGVLRLMFESIAEFSLGDAWMEAQVGLLVEVCEGPVTLRRMDELQRRLNDIIFKQGELKRAAVNAQDDTRRLFSGFVAQLAGMADLSQTRSQDLADCARSIAGSSHPDEVQALLGKAARTLDDMAQHTQAMSGEMQAMQARVADSEAELERLRHELDVLSLANRHDALTGALNRKGLDEVLVREVARARKAGSPLSIALLDIDNFKVINDQHGHPVGDAALSHLADMARASIRTQDTLCRYGGEEFVILLPDTALDDGVAEMQKLQRALTREIFLADSRRILITFSAGVAELAPGEDAQATIERADRGMYQAKRSGKNQVLAA